MQERLISILLFCFFKSVLSFSAARTVDPITLALEQILSDITFEIVPYPTYPNAGPTCSNIYYDPPNQCGTYNPYNCMNPYDQCCPCGLEYSPNICNPMPYDQYGLWEYGPNIWASPMCDQCLFDTCPSCNCYRDIKNPCSICEDSSPMYICFENCGCGCNTSPPPYIYFPEVEYPMSAMDMHPYFYGSCWCS